MDNEASVTVRETPPLHTPSKSLDAPGHQSLSRHRWMTHHPKCGINPLVDSAAYLFSIIGKLKQLKAYRHLHKLHKELAAEINTFQDTAKAHGYSAEYILVSRYALCVALDDAIANMPWGGLGQWDQYSLLTLFSQEPVQSGRFFVILERIIKNPELYIDMMEFMYICLSLGFKHAPLSADINRDQYEQWCHALYKRIRAHHGGFNKSLSLFPTKNKAQRTLYLSKPVAFKKIIGVTIGMIAVLAFGLGLLLSTLSNQAYRELTTIGKSISYEAPAA